MLGGPGSGKGTLCSKIVETYGWVHLSAGDLLRAERKDPSLQARRAHQRIYPGGKIVPVEITLALIRKAMEAATTDFLVDGFPRSADNLKGWEDNMTTHGRRFIIIPRNIRRSHGAADHAAVAGDRRGGRHGSSRRQRSGHQKKAEDVPRDHDAHHRDI